MTTKMKRRHLTTFRLSAHARICAKPAHVSLKQPAVAAAAALLRHSLPRPRLGRAAARLSSMCDASLALNTFSSAGYICTATQTACANICDLTRANRTSVELCYIQYSSRSTWPSSPGLFNCFTVSSHIGNVLLNHFRRTNSKAKGFVSAQIAIRRDPSCLNKH